MRRNVEKPCTCPLFSSRSITTASFSARSSSNWSRRVPVKYAASKPYICSRSQEVVASVGTTEPTSRRPQAGSKGGDIHVGRAFIELFIEAASVGPFSQIQPAWVKNMGVPAGNRRKRVARVKPNQQVIEFAGAGHVVKLPQERGENRGVILRDANEGGIDAAQFFARTRQSPSAEPGRAQVVNGRRRFQPAGIPVNHGLLVCGLIPQPSYAD